MQSNRIEAAGYLVSKPELRYLPSGMKVANVKMGESHSYMGSDGSMQTQTNWHSLCFYDDLADVAMKYEKGNNVFVEGRIEQRRVTPKGERPRTVHEIFVRSSHLIAQPGSPNGKPKEASETVPQEAEPGAQDDWPVA